MIRSALYDLARALEMVDQGEKFFRERAEWMGLPGVDIQLSSSGGPDGIYIRLSTYKRACFKQAGMRAVSYGHAIGLERFDAVVRDAVAYLKAKGKT